jgi:glycosyltransferase involved in cell wall biosynthesis
MSGGRVRVLIVSLSTYSAPYNDGKLVSLGSRLEALKVVAGNVTTLWGKNNRSRSGRGYEVVVLPVRFARSNATTQLMGLDEIADAVRPNIVHVECEPWQLVAVQSVRIAKRLDVPIGVLFAENGPQLRGVGGALRRARGSWVLNRCDYAVGWSKDSTQVAQRLAPGIQTETFPATGVSPSAVSAVSADQWFGVNSAALPKLAFVGRFAEEKGVREFLDVCDELARRRPIRAALAGGEGEQKLVRRWTEERPWAFLHGILPRTQVSSLLTASDVLICPSRTTRFAKEQFGKTAVEAMMVGTPVFAYDCGALLDTIGSGGVVVPEGAQGQLVEELEKYFGAPTAGGLALAQEARRQARQFTDDVLAERLVELWSKMPPTRGGPTNGIERPK